MDIEIVNGRKSIYIPIILTEQDHANLQGKTNDVLVEDAYCLEVSLCNGNIEFNLLNEGFVIL